MTEIQNSKQKKQLLWTGLEFEVWDLFGIWCLEFVISKKCERLRKVYDNMRKKQLTYIFLFFLFSVFLFTGCAHRPVTPSQAVSEDIQPDQNRQSATTEAGQIPSDPDIEDNSDEDFFNDEFEEAKVEVADPFSLWNRAMFHFNDKLVFIFFKNFKLLLICFVISV